MASTFLVTKSSIWPTCVAASPRASATMTSTPAFLASWSTDCLIWLKKSACRLATASPMRTLSSSQRWENAVASPRSATMGASTMSVPRLIMSLSWKRRSGPSGLFAAQDVEHHRERDDDADDDLLHERRDLEQ